MTNKWVRIGGVVIFFCICFAIGSLFAQRGTIQTDYKDIGSRQKIDRNLWGSIEVLDEQIQADTVYLTPGNTADTVQLDNKYKDTHFQVFVEVQTARDASSLLKVKSNTDSSFIITKHVDDSSTVQWMSVHK